MQHINDVVSIAKPRPVAKGTMIPHLLCGIYFTASQEFIVIVIIHDELLCLTREQVIPNCKLLITPQIMRIPVLMGQMN